MLYPVDCDRVNTGEWKERRVNRHVAVGERMGWIEKGGEEGRAIRKIMGFIKTAAVTCWRPGPQYQ